MERVGMDGRQDAQRGGAEGGRQLGVARLVGGRQDAQGRRTGQQHRPAGSFLGRGRGEESTR